MKVTTGSEIMMHRYDDRLRGEITIRNEFASNYILYKLKSTNSSLFEANPSTGIITPKQTHTITVTTLDPINLQLAKQLSHMHKFMIEYVVTRSDPTSDNIHQMLHKNPNSQSQKIYINTTNVRGEAPRSREYSEVNSNKFTYRSVLDRNRKTTENPSEKLEQLKLETEQLQRERSALINGTSHPQVQKSSHWKKILVVVLGAVLGNVLGRGVNFNHLLETPEPEPVEEEDNFWDIFDFGLEEEKDGGEGWSLF